MNAWLGQIRGISLAALAARARAWLIAPPDEAAQAGLAVPVADRRAEAFVRAGSARLRAVAPLAPSPVEPATRHAAAAAAQSVAAAEPASRPPLTLAPAPAEPLEPPRPVVAVLGLAPGAGGSTVARALAARLAADDPCAAAVLVTPDSPRPAPATAAAARLARALLDRGIDGARAAGRLCVVPGTEPLPPIAGLRPAPVVADIAHGAPAEGATALADHVVLVCPPDVEPALAAAVETTLRRAGQYVSLVLNRVIEEPPARLAHALLVPDSRVAAQLTLACREPRGALAEAAAELAERSLAEVWQ